MRVALVSPYGLDHPGGVQDQVLRLCDWLNRSGHEAWMVAPGLGDGWHSAGDVMLLPANRSLAPIALAPGAVRRALRALRGADVVHVHEPLMPAVSLGVTLRSDLPVVGTFHADPSRLVRGVYRMGRRPLQRVVARLQAVTAPSEVAAGAVAPFAAARVIPNAIDVAAFAVEEPRHPARVVFVGRDEPRKGLGLLLDAWPAVVAEHPAAEAIVISDTERSPVPGVRFVGRVDEQEKCRLLASAAVLVAPNTGGESFGIVVAEGMAAGCAVIASGLPAFAGVLGDTGALIRPGDVEAIASAVNRLLGDPAEAGRLGEAARLRAGRFDIAAVGPAYLEAYGDAIAAVRQGPGR